MYIYFRVLKESSKFTSSKARMTETTRKEMEAGKLPSRRQDRTLVTSTFYDYRSTVNKLMTVFCKEIGREIRMSDFFSFGELSLIEPQRQVSKWFTDHVPSPTERYI